MKKKKIATRSALFTSCLSLFLCVTMLIGTTMAWFTDTAKSGVNKIVAGNLDIEVEYINTDDTTPTWKNLEDSASVFSQGLWEPGHTEFVTLKIMNKGTLALNYKVNVSPISESGGINMAGNSYKLSDYLVFGTTAASETEPSYTRDTARSAVGTTVKLNQSALTKESTILKDGQPQYITLVVYMPETVGNEANYKTGTTAPQIELGITVVATQQSAENDSFGDDYDTTANLTPDNSGADAIVYNYVPQITQAAQITKSSSSVTNSAQDNNVTIDNDNNLTVKSSVKVSEVTGNTADNNKEFANVIVPATVINKLSDGDHTIELNVKKDDTANANFKAATNAPDLTEKETVTYEVNVVKDGVKVATTDSSDPVYTVKLFVGANRANLVMYHNDIAMTAANTGAADTFSYDATTGYVTMYVNTFSPFTAVYDEPVAAIGTTVYYSLSSAVAAADNNDVICLLMNQSVERINLDSKDIKLNLNGYTVTGVSNYGIVFCVKNGHTLTIDGNTDGSAIKGSIMCGTNGAYGHAVVNGGTYTGYKYCPFYVNGSVSDVCNLTITNATIKSSPESSDQPESNFGLYLAGKNLTVLTNCEITGSDTGLEVRAGDVTLNNCTVSGNANPASFTNNDNGGTIKGAAIAVSQHTTNYATKVTVNGGTYTAVYSLYEKDSDNIAHDLITLDVKGGNFNGEVNSDNCVGFISGGTFSSDPTNYLADGACCAEVSTGIYSVGTHELLKHDAKLATCTENGALQYFTCKQCGAMCWYENGKCEFTDVSLTVSVASHKYMVDSIEYLENSKVNVEGKDVYKNVNVTYKCPDCGDSFTREERLVTLEVAQAGCGSTSCGTQTTFYVIADGAYIMNGSAKATFDIGKLFVNSYANNGSLLQEYDVIKFPAVNVYHDRKNYDAPTMYGNVTIWGTDTGKEKTTFMLDDNKSPNNNRGIRINHRSNETLINNFNFVDVNFQPTNECDCSLIMFNITTVNIFVGCKNVEIYDFGGGIFGCWCAETLADGSYANHKANAGVTVRMVGGSISNCSYAVGFDTKPYNTDYASGKDAYAFTDVKFSDTIISNTLMWKYNSNSNIKQGNWYLNGDLVLAD